MSENRTRPESPDPIAIIGMSLRVPGANSPEQLWENLVSGTDSITRFEKEDLDFPEEFDQEGYVPARGIVEGIENFDASFFGILPKEAEIMDPQQRLFLELAWEVVERAGYAASRMDRKVGVYAGTYMNSYLLANLCSDRQFLDDTVNQARVGSLATEIASDKDYLATRVAYKMNLNGPAMTVGTACSTSLVAVAEACRAIRDGLCEMALAGGVTLTVPYRRGYTYTDKGINSIDGRCRVFDKDATGTVFSNGAGVVMLKKLSDAQRDGDHIHAVIRGVGLNNDGSNKVSFAAPSVKGQVNAIRAAQLDADIDPETISLIEAHGTGTPLGDPIEVRALNRAFKEAGVEETGFCALGSLKSYIGHLDVAAGVCGLIKTALSLENKKLPALLHFEEPHPKINLEDSPFFPVAELTDWNRRDEDTPLRAGVSSFGVGGTNAHLVLEEAINFPSRNDDGIPRVVPVSAKTEKALADAVSNLHEAVTSGTVGSSLPDVAWTLAKGREEFPHRCSFVASSLDELASATGSFRPGNSATGAKPESVSFLFPGQGSQQVNMARSLYESAPEFRKSFDRCCEILQPILDEDLSALLFPAEENDESVLQEKLRDTGFAQPAIFAVEYSLALWWMKGGLRPDSMVGHSVGEFVAACLAGVFSLEDALRVVAMRGQLMSSLPAGSMLSVRLEEETLLARLPESLDLAAINAPGLCVVAGPDAAITDFQKQLDKDSIPSTLLHTSHAFHSRMMDPAVGKFRECIESIQLQSPGLPILSTVTAEWLTEEQATDANYWAGHLRETVRFGDAITKLATETSPQLFLEVGPGQTLLQLTNLTLGRDGSAHLVLPSCSHPKDETPDLITALETAGKIWNNGLSIAWDSFFEGTPCNRVPLPTYPFQRKRHWIEPSPAPGTLPLTSTASGRPDSPATPPEPAPAPFPTTPSDKTASLEKPVSTMNACPSRMETLASETRLVLTNLSGIPVEELDGQSTFLELGFDSLLLTQVSRGFQDRFGTELNMRQLLSDVSSIDAVAAFLDETLPEDAFREVIAAEPAQATPEPIAEIAPAAQVNGVQPSSEAGLMQAFLTQQMELLQTQLASLRGQAAAAAPALSTQSAGATPAKNTSPEPPRTRQQLCGSNLALNSSASETKAASDVSAPSTSINRDNDTALTPDQQTHLDYLLASYTAKTARSKELTTENRQWFADPRTVSGFNRLWKEMIYQIVVHESKGSRLIDADGNEYIDILNGFGPGFLGHSPDFITEALHEQLDRGVAVGPQNETAMEAARLFCEVTGNERASFVNTGSEAVQAAMRLSRTVTGRDKIVVFARDYHGNFDEVLVRGVGSGDSRRSMPLAPGIPNRAVEDVIVLPYGDDESLEFIREHANELAAVVVEPIQSRRPEFHPVEFIREIRALTLESGTALVFDEVITGFRAGPKGAQGFFGVEADLATYGKICGGGMPIGVVAGKAEFMDTFDGGQWQYGDDSFPEKGVTFFAGTFVRHPLAMVAAKQMLLHLKKEGPALWDNLNAKADRLAHTVDRMFVENNVPFRIPNFGSLLFIRQVEDNPFANLLFFHLRNKGVFLLEGFPCYLTTAHTDEDIDYVIQAFKESVSELQASGFFPKPAQQTLATLNGARLTGPPPVLRDGKKQPAEENGPTTPSEKTEPAIAAEVFPLTESLAEIYLASSVSDEASLCFNEVVVLTLEGKLNRGALEKALQQVIDRHEVTRAVFLEGGEGFKVLPYHSIDLPLRNLTSLSGEDQASELQKQLDYERATPFPLHEEPLFRAQLLQMTGTSHTLILNAHHLVCDGASFNQLIDDFSILYTAACKGTSPDLPPAPSFTRHAQRTAEEEARSAGGPGEAYWMERFSEPVPPLRLPLDKAPGENPDYRVDTVRMDLDPAMVRQLRMTAGKSGATLFSILLATYQTLLSRISRQKRVLSMFPVAGQSLPGNENLVGHCVHFLPFVSEIDPDQSFSDFLGTTQHDLLDTFEHQDTTFGQLLKKLPASSRLEVEAVFTLERMDGYEEFSGLQTTVDDPHRDFGINPLFLNAMESSEGLALNLTFQSALFARETVEEWLSTLVAMLEMTVAKPECTVGKIASTLSSRQEQLALEWNQTETDYPSDKTAGQLFDEVVDNHCNAIALASEEGSMKYGDLSKLVDRFAKALQDKGAATGEWVGIFLERSPESIAAMLAVLKTGAAYVPLDPEYPAERIQLMIQDSGLDIVLTHKSLRDRLPRGVKTVIEVQSIGKSAKPFEPTTDVTADSPACLLYTSGSTGTPKGSVIPHRAIVRLVRNTNFCDFREDDTLLQAASICFDASLFEIHGALLNGGTLAIPPAGYLTLDTISKSIRNHKVTVLWLTSGLFQLMVDEEIDAFRGVRQIIAGGDVVPATHASRLLAAFPDIHLTNGYGPTEGTTFTTTHHVTDKDLQSKSLPIGRPISNSTVWILDDSGNPVPPGIPGELHVGGDGLALEYLNQEEMTKERFLPDPFSNKPGARLYRTGDLCRFRSDGLIEFFGRMDHQVKIRGFRVEPGEIEIHLSRHPEVNQCKVVVRTDASGQKSLVAYVSPFNSCQPDPDALRDHLRSKFPDYMVPAACIVMEELPINANGKIDTWALPAPGEDLPASLDCGEETLTPTEESLTSLWKEVLRINSVGLDDDFFALGGHSLLGMKLFSRLQKENQILLPLSVLFQSPTIRQLAQVIDREDSAEGPPQESDAENGETPGQEPFPQGKYRNLSDEDADGASSAIAEATVLLQSEGDQNPIFAVHGGDGGIFFYRNLADRLDRDRPFYAFEASVLTDGEEIYGEPVEETAKRYVEELLQLQPDGDIHLCGYSFGGVVAYEMAAQLTEMGRSVAFVGLVDTENPVVEARKLSLSERVSVNWKERNRPGASILEKVGNLGKRVGTGLGYRLRFGAEGTVGRVMPTSKNTGWLRQIQVRQAYERAMDSYDPPAYSGDITLFRATEGHDKYDLGEDYGWSQAVSGKIHVIDVPGNHISIFHETNIDGIAEAMREALHETVTTL